MWCPDWPVVAWGIPLDEPAAVMSANRVIAASPAARAHGVQVGQRRREAQGRYPDVALVDRDDAREARLFEPVVEALTTITPRVEVTGPGLAGFPTRGPSRFFGGDETLHAQTVETVTGTVGAGIPVQVGVADGIFAARLAARSRRSPIVAPGASPQFLAPITIHELGLPHLTSVLDRLAIRTLGALAELPLGDVVGRFGNEGLLGHRLASGEDEYPPDLRRPAPDMAATWHFDPPADRVESCAFVAKMLADQVHDTLLARGLACTRIAIEAETEDGQTRLRLWRHESTLSAAAIADRTRWQLEGWLHDHNHGHGHSHRSSADPHPPANAGVGAISRISLIPDEVVAATGRQLDFWGGSDRKTQDVTRVVARLQALLDPEAVTVPEPKGGISPGERFTTIPAGAVDLAERLGSSPTHRDITSEPWPGQIPAPSPAALFPFSHGSTEVDVVDAEGCPVHVTGRGEISASPWSISLGSPTEGAPHHRLSATGKVRIIGWAGPWPADQRCWDTFTHRRRARLQVTLADGSAHLLVREDGRWTVEATY